MSILIKGMEMPKNCYNCWLGHKCPKYEALLWNEIDKERKTDCPLVPVPAHGRLLDADVICEECRRVAEEFDGIYPDCTYCPVHLSPTIIPASGGRDMIPWIFADLGTIIDCYSEAEEGEA